MSYICTVTKRDTNLPSTKLTVSNDRRAEILDATLALIAGGGIDAIRYRDVATQAGVPLGTVSYHFAARPALLEATFRHFFARNTELLLGLGARAPRGRREDVAAFLCELIRIDFADPERRVLAEYELILYAGRHPDLAAVLAGWDRMMVAELAPALEALDIANPIATARTLTEMLRGFELVNLGRTLAEIEEPLADFGRRVSALLTRGSTRGKNNGNRQSSR
jgi:DNA-binding transcriptional regulator YbjK